MEGKANGDNCIVIEIICNEDGEDVLVKGRSNYDCEERTT